MAAITLKKNQQQSLRHVLDLVCAEDPADVLLIIACRFREHIDWSKITATSTRSQGRTQRLILAFPIGLKAEGFINIQLWHDQRNELSLSMNSSDNYDFAVHRRWEGEVWSGLGAFVQEMDVVMAA